MIKAKPKLNYITTCHDGPISSVASFGNKLVATAGYDNKIILWDAHTKLPISLGQHDHLINHCEFSHDGKLLVTSSSDCTSKIWNTTTMNKECQLVGHKDDIEMTKFSPSGRLLATASRDCTIKLFNETGKFVQQLNAHTSDVISVDWLSDTELVSSSDDGTIRYWDIVSGQKNIWYKSETEIDTLISFLRDSVIAGTDEGEILIITRNSLKSFKAHSVGIKRLVLSPLQNFLICLSYDQSISFWSIIDGNNISLKHNKTISAIPIAWLRSACFLKQTQVVFGTFGSSYATYSITEDTWNIDNIHDTNVINAITVVNDDIYSVGDSGVVLKNNKHYCHLGSLCNEIISVGRKVYAGGQLGLLYNINNKKEIHNIKSPINCAATYKLKGRSFLVVGNYKGELHLFESFKNFVKPLNMVKAFDNPVKGVACTDRTIFCVCADGAATEFNSDLSQRLWLNDKAHSKIANDVVVLGVKDFVSVSRDKYMRIWIDKEIQVLDTPHSHSIKCVAATTNGKYIATGAYNGKVAIYDLDNKKWTTYIPTRFGISDVTVDSYERAFLCSSYDGCVYQIPII